MKDYGLALAKCVLEYLITYDEYIELWEIEHGMENFYKHQNYGHQ